jgi:Leucine-rich repeat (LRR) protein
MENLKVIDLSRNNLSGGIPSSMCSLPYLEWLQLSNNNLSGDLLSLKYCSSRLSTLDLGENRLSGTIPKWIGERLSTIEVLRLRGNMLFGKIPEQLCRLTYIHVLDLAHNNFSGSIPTCLGSLVGYINVDDSLLICDFPRHMDLVVKGRQYEFYDQIFLVNTIDFSRNCLSGEIPTELTNLTLLNTLNLSSNQLTGKIPENIGALRQLETLDLSNNHLSGHIPPSMSSMTFLSHLNLSYNNLSGQIPSTNQFSTFDPSIYEGNPQLFGPPLPTNSSTPSDGDAEHKDHEDVPNDGEEQFEKVWLYLSIALGFIVGFWAVCGSLVIKKSWRHAYFCFVDKMKDRLLVVIAVNMARLQRKYEAERQ